MNDIKVQIVPSIDPDAIEAAARRAGDMFLDVLAEHMRPVRLRELPDENSDGTITWRGEQYTKVSGERPILTEEPSVGTYVTDAEGDVFYRFGGGTGWCWWMGDKWSAPWPYSIIPEPRLSTDDEKAAKGVPNV